MNIREGSRYVLVLSSPQTLYYTAERMHRAAYRLWHTKPCKATLNKQGYLHQTHTKHRHILEIALIIYLEAPHPEEI